MAHLAYQIHNSETPSSGDKPQTGETSIAITDHHGYGVAPVPGAPVHETDMVLCSEGLHALKQVAPAVGVALRGAYLNRDGGVDAARHRQGIVNAGLLPHITANPRHRKRPKRGRQRLVNATSQARRLCVERTCAWEDQCTRRLLRFERIQQRPYGIKLLAYTLINLRAFCGV